MQRPEPSKSYMAAARYLFYGVKFLCQGGHEVVNACAHLAGQSLECLLKAYLSKKGIGVNTLKRKPYRHDLKKLWEEAVDNGLEVSKQPPVWCLILNQTHNEPYYLRYPIGINGFSVPACSQMLDELSKLIDQVGAIV